MSEWKSLSQMRLLIRSETAGSPTFKGAHKRIGCASLGAEESDVHHWEQKRIG